MSHQRESMISYVEGADINVNSFASDSDLLRQECMELKARLARVKGFAQYFSSSQESSSNLISDLQQVFAQGKPLCELYNMLSIYDFHDPISLDMFKNLPRAQAAQRALARFTIRAKVMCELRLIGEGVTLDLLDVIDPESVEGFEQVTKIVTALLDLLPQWLFRTSSISFPVENNIPLTHKSDANFHPAVTSTDLDERRLKRNDQIVISLIGRVSDWKGHNPSKFGNLIMEGVFTLRRGHSDRVHHIFLFEKIILCCKFLLPEDELNPALYSSSHSSTSPLALKGRVFVTHLRKAVPNYQGSAPMSSLSHRFPLSIWWRDGDALESFTMWCRGADQRQRWLVAVNNLIEPPEAEASGSVDEGYYPEISEMEALPSSRLRSSTIYFSTAPSDTVPPPAYSSPQPSVQPRPNSFRRFSLRVVNFLSPRGSASSQEKPRFPKGGGKV